MTPNAAVAENFDQLTALPSHSRLSRKNLSFVVPWFIKALQNVTAVWNIELRPSRLSRTLFKMLRSANWLTIIKCNGCGTCLCDYCDTETRDSALSSCFHPGLTS